MYCNGSDNNYWIIILGNYYWNMSLKFKPFKILLPLPVKYEYVSVPTQHYSVHKLTSLPFPTHPPPPPSAILYSLVCNSHPFQTALLIKPKQHLLEGFPQPKEFSPRNYTTRLQDLHKPSPILDTYVLFLLQPILCPWTPISLERFLK